MPVQKAGLGTAGAALPECAGALGCCNCTQPSRVRVHVTGTRDVGLAEDPAPPPPVGVRPAHAPRAPRPAHAAAVRMPQHRPCIRALAFPGAPCAGLLV